jgi:hypothetical protein
VHEVFWRQADFDRGVSKAAGFCTVRKVLLMRMRRCEEMAQRSHLAAFAMATATYLVTVVGLLARNAFI